MSTSVTGASNELSLSPLSLSLSLSLLSLTPTSKRFRSRTSLPAFSLSTLDGHHSHKQVASL